MVPTSPWTHLLAHKTVFGVGREVDTSDFHVEVIDLLGNKAEAEIGAALFHRRLLELAQGGPRAGAARARRHEYPRQHQAVRSLVEPLQVAMDNGAKRALIPIEKRRNLPRCFRGCPRVSTDIWKRWLKHDCTTYCITKSFPGIRRTSPVNSRCENQLSETIFGSAPTRRDEQPPAGSGAVPGLQRGDLQAESGFAQVRLGGGRGLSSNPLFSLFQCIKNHTKCGGCCLENPGATLAVFTAATQAGRCTACKTACSGTGCAACGDKASRTG